MKEYVNKVNIILQKSKERGDVQTL